MPRCETCNCLPEDCDCFTCDRCGSWFHVDDYGEDGYCVDCVDARNTESRDSHDGPCVVTYRSCTATKQRGLFTKDTPDRLVGVEIEVASAQRDNHISRAARRWTASIVRDGSLPDSGFEITTAPASGCMLEQQLADLGEALSKDGATVEALGYSTRWPCGLHVHVDCQDHSYTDIQRLMLAYAWLEPALYKLVPPSRRQNGYCRPCGQRFVSAIRNGTFPKADKTPGQWVKQTVLGGTYNTISPVDTRLKKREKYDATRYSACNVHSWIYRGTVELRLFSGTVQAEKILRCAQVWSQIVEWSYRHTAADLDAMEVAWCNTWPLSERLRPILTPSVFAWAKARAESFSS